MLVNNIEKLVFIENNKLNYYLNLYYFFAILIKFVSILFTLYYLNCYLPIDNIDENLLIKENYVIQLRILYELLSKL